MKNFTLILLLLSVNLTAQITTLPGTPKVSNEVTLILNTIGTELDGYTGDIYAHTGVTINGVQWQNTIGSWGDNSVQPKFSKIDNHTYHLVLTKNIHSFYNIVTSNTITEINLVCRSSDNSKQTRPDTHLPIFKDELNILITNPIQNKIFELGNSINITAESPINANLELLINNTSIHSVSNKTSITNNYTFTTTGNQVIKATASDGTNIKEQEISVYVKTVTQTESLPSAVKNGVNLNNDGSVTFVLFAPQKKDVFLIGEFNNWELNPNYQLKKDGNTFWITLNNLDADTEYAYQYLIDYDKKIADPYAEKILDKNNDIYISDINYPNLKTFPTATSGIVSTFKINTTPYVWKTSSFTRPAKEKMVIYELLVRDFSADDSFQSVINKLDYLQNLGINALELMPVNEFEGNDSWGYNVSQFFALDKAYGTKNKFKELIDKCHERGIAIIIDAVFNHSYSQCPLVQMYEHNNTNGTTTNNPFYNEKHNFIESGLQFGFDFNHESTYTQEYFKDVMSYWIEEYKIDGFRLDFTKGFTNTTYNSGDFGSAYNQNRIDRLTDYANYVWSKHGNDFYMILEHLADNKEEKVLADNGMMLWGKMTHNYNQNTMGYNSDTDISWGYYKNRNFTSPNLVTYMESHDEERLMYKNIQFGNSNGNYNVKKLNTALSREELAGVFFFTIPGPKMIWQFGELGYDISIDENGRTGRKPLKWEYETNSERKKVYNIWSKLIALKKEHDVFSSTDVTFDVKGLVKRIGLHHSSNNVVIIGNFDIIAKNINPNFPAAGTWYEYFTETSEKITNTTSSITLQPGEYRLYSSKKLDGTLSPEENEDKTSNLSLFPNPPSNYFMLNKEVDEITIFDISGKKAQNLSSNLKSNEPIYFNKLSSGLYIIKIKKDGSYTQKKLIIK